MSKLDKLIAELCPDGVIFKRLEDCCTLEKGNTPIQKAVAGKYPLVVTTAERRTCNMYQFDKPTVCIPLVSSRGHGVACLNQLYYQEGAFALGNILCGVTPKGSHELSAKFLHCYLNHHKDILIVPLMKGGANVSLTVSSLKKVKVPVPPLYVQNEIVNMLSNFENLILELTAELTARKKQYEYYRDALFSNVALNGAREVLLQDISEFVTVGIANSATHAYSASGTIMFRNQNIKVNHLDDSDLIYITPEFAKKYQNKSLKSNDILVTRTGYPGQACLVPERYEGCQTFTTLIVRLKETESICPMYICYFINSGLGKAYVDKMKSGAAQQNFGAKFLEKMPILLPTIEQQNKIVSMLDRFDTLCNGISTGLPAEIEARRKQYEYYRDKLLTFKELS